jgi:death on curing protein
LPSEPIWLADSQVVRINERLVGLTGEPHFLRDPGLLSSAMSRPINRWAYGDEDIVNLAGVLLLGIGRNHPFEQGNKRTALTAATIFLMFNGYTFVAPDGEPLGQFMELSLTGAIKEPVFMATMHRCTVTTEEWEAFVRTSGRRP